MSPADSARASLRAQTTGVSALERSAAGRWPGAEAQYRLPLAGVRRTADFALPAERTAIFVDGCFWHGHGCRPRPVKTNEEYWSEKVARNRARDLDTDARLAAEGWSVLRLWECELLGGPRGGQDDHTAPGAA